MYTRHLQPVAKELLSEFRIVYLTGPRQSGKTTLARALAADLAMDYISLDDQSVLATATDDPHGFIRSLEGRRVVLDEFQYIQALVPAIKEVSDCLAPSQTGKFLLTGSSDIFRSAKTQEALPGHMARLELLPLSLAELHAHPRNLVDSLLAGDFSQPATPSASRRDIASLILKGGYPEAQEKSPRARQVWYKSYTEGRFYKDFESLYAARGDYRSRLRALASYLAGRTGNLLRYASIANGLQLDDRLTKRYLEILELMFIIRRLPAWRKNRAKRSTAMPKLHYLDTGLACHLLGLRDAEQVSHSQYYGGLFETLIYTECLKHAPWATEEVDLYYFRDNRQREVDLVLERPNSNIIGLEVKASASVHRTDFNGLFTLADYAGSAFERGLMLYTGQHPLTFRHATHTFHALPLATLLPPALPRPQH